MNWLEKEKFYNAIRFFSKEHYQYTGKFPSQTAIYKYISMFDFRILKKTGIPSLNINNYVAMEFGPVPIELYKEKPSNDYFSFEENQPNAYIVKAVGKVEKKYFSKVELQTMRELIQEYAKDFVNANDMSNDSHKEIKAWQKAYNKKHNSPMTYSDELEDDIKNKKEDELTQLEENHLIYLGLKGYEVK